MMLMMMMIMMKDDHVYVLYNARSICVAGVANMCRMFVGDWVQTFCMVKMGSQRRLKWLGVLA